MSHRIIGITVEFQSALLYTKGYLSDFQCKVDPDDCCDEDGGLTGSGIGAPACCGDSEPNATVGFHLEGPILAGCVDGSMDGDLLLDTGGSQIWAGDGNFGSFSELGMTLYCVGGEWQVSGNIKPPNEDGFFFDAPLTLDPTTGMLVGSFERPGCGTVTVSVEPPCAGAVTWNCVEGACEAVLGNGGTYANQAACVAACGSSWNCVSGVCTEVVGPSGTYDSLIACSAACVLSVCGCSLPYNITATVSAGICGGSGTLTWNGTTGWAGSVVLSGGTGGTINILLYCEGGVWKASTTGCHTVTGGTTTGACTPSWQSGLFISACCGGGNFNIFFTY